MDELELADVEGGATYREIIGREYYHFAKSEETRQPVCPPEKEKAIVEALRHFGMV